MTRQPAGPKDIERSYYAQIGAEGIAHALRKPFADATRGQLLLEFGAALSIMPPPPARVIDLGCGVGWTTDFLARSGYEATGVDLSPEAVAVASEAHTTDGVRFVVHDYEESIDDPGTYDIALFFDALHHCSDVDAALRTAAEALRPGGTCVVVEPGRGHAHSPTSLEARARYGVSERELPPKLILAAARGAGFGAGRVYPFPSEIQQLLYPVPGTHRRGLRRLLDTRPGRWLLMLRATDFNRQRSGLVRLER